MVKIVNGRPVPYYVEPFDPDELKMLAGSAFATPYKPTMWDTAEDIERFTGMSNAQVASLKQAEQAAGGLDPKDRLSSYRELMDRIVGKPKQQTENLNVNITLNDFIDSAPEIDSVVYAEDVVFDTTMTELSDDELADLV